MLNVFIVNFYYLATILEKCDASGWINLELFSHQFLEIRKQQYKEIFILVPIQIEKAKS